ncbi:chymotrypsin-1-like [Trichogramma pretiosum]|uniref:chymotrypsin-1-like n=1 Tax=Trichogramma pretiosum TaxID=7493 RepID=UPI0006C9613D|nr:chymotrypsin-1-like [Trichogramma pretiosum]
MSKFVECIFFALIVIAVEAIRNNGELAEISEFPFQVSLRINGGHSCGGVLITRKHVLTAAHCVNDYIDPAEQNLWSASIEFGATHLNAGLRYPISRISIHKDFKNEYKPMFLPNDVAVIHLRNSVKLSPTIQTIALPRMMIEVPMNTSLIVSGYGLVNHTAYLPWDSPLRKFETKVAGCEAINTTTLWNVFCDELRVGYAACNGDSGSGIIDANTKTLVGIVSGIGDECGAGIEPDVFLKVSYYIPYIKSELAYDPENSKIQSEHPARNVEEIFYINDCYSPGCAYKSKD